ncbi:SipW-dependent-type signal peptide-containing protein [Arthrobacter sp. C152]
MLAVEEVRPESGKPARKAPKIRAILAGGLVLGIGATVTLAAWNDSEFAKGTFAAGVLNLESSTDGANFATATTAANPATLAFTSSTTNLTPGDVVESPFAIRLSDLTTYDADVRLSTAGSTGSLAGLTYQLDRTSTFGCGGQVLGTAVTSTTPLGTTPDGVTFSLSQGGGTDPGAPVFLCFRVTAGSGLTQGQTGTTTWEFAAQSK